jgi:hypothetical protein
LEFYQMSILSESFDRSPDLLLEIERVQNQRARTEALVDQLHRELIKIQGELACTEKRAVRAELQLAELKRRNGK